MMIEALANPGASTFFRGINVSPGVANAPRAKKHLLRPQYELAQTRQGIVTR